MSHKIVINISFVIVVLTTLNCNNISGYEVNDICKMSPRKIEKLNFFKVKGVVSENYNFGFINTFIISDTKNKDAQIFIISDKNTSPGLVGEIVHLNLRLYKEISFGGERLILFEEYQKK